MSVDCTKVSDSIWDNARDGAELSDEELAHIEVCDSCAKTLAEARSCVAALRCIEPYPAGFDCRSAVIERIRPRRRRLVAAWACAFALVVAGMAIGGLLLHRGNRCQNSATNLRGIGTAMRMYSGPENACDAVRAQDPMDCEVAEAGAACGCQQAHNQAATSHAPPAQAGAFEERAAERAQACDRDPRTGGQSAGGGQRRAGLRHVAVGEPAEGLIPIQLYQDRSDNRRGHEVLGEAVGELDTDRNGIGAGEARQQAGKGERQQ